MILYTATYNYFIQTAYLIISRQIVTPFVACEYHFFIGKMLVSDLTVSSIF